MSGRIVVGVDGTDGGRRALDWALRQAVVTHVPVLVASVYYDPTAQPGRTPAARARWARDEAERHLREDVDAVLARLDERPEIETTVAPGDVTAHVLAKLAQDADLLVVGSHGHNVVTSRVLGTVSMGCVGSAVCPVVVIPARERPPACSPDVTVGVTARTPPDSARAAAP